MNARFESRVASQLLLLRATLLLISLVTTGGGVLADELAEPIEFLRIGVPRGRLSELGLKAIPVKRQEFEQRIAELNAKYHAMTDPVGTRVISGIYTARVAGEDLVDGRAALEVKHALPQPGYVRLEPLQLAVQSLRWRGEDRPVAVGRAAGKDLVAAVEKDGTLELTWSLSGHRNRESVLQFDLSLPDAAVNELVLEIPDSHQPICARAIVTRVAESEEAGNDAAPDESLRRWRIELGAETNATLQIVANDRVEQASPLTLAHSTRSYALDASGLEFREAFTLSPTHRAIDHLTLDADAGLRIAAVTVDGQPVDLAQRERVAGERPAYDLAFREPVAGQAQLIVDGFAPVTFDKPWKLPTTTLREVVWSAGVMRLEVGDTKLVRRLRSADSRLRVSGPLPAPRLGEAFEFDLLRPRGSCEVLLRRTEQEKISRLFTSIRLGDSNVSARVIAELTSAGQPAYSFLLSRDPQWVIDSIETVPADVIQGQTVLGRSGQARKLRLARAATSAMPVRIIVRARRSVEPGERVTGENLRPIVFADTRQESNIVAVSTEAPLQLETFGDANLSRLAVQSLPEADRDLFAPEESALVYRDGPDADGLQVSAARTLPRFNSRANVNVNVESEVLRVEYLLQCELISSQLSELEVQFSAPVPRPIQWTIVGDRAGTVQARRSAADTWQLTLPRPRNVSFSLRATTEIPLTDAFPIPLATLPQADIQSGTLVIGTNDGTQLAIEHRGLKAVPIDPDSSPNHAQIQGAFRYASLQNLFVGVRPISFDKSHKVWVQGARLTSRLDASGRMAHDLRLRVRNLSASHITLQLPQDAAGRSVVIGERNLLWPGTVDQLTVPLPRGVPNVVLSIRYDQQVQRGVAFTALQPLLPELDVPCIDWRWSVWLPPGTEAMPDARLASGKHPNQLLWDQRLFGYSLFRRTGKPFSLLEPVTWPSVVGNSARYQQVQHAGSCLATMDEILVRDGFPDSSLTWGEVLREFVQSDETENPLWIDKTALAEAGISAASQLPLNRSGGASAAALLRTSKLLLVATPRGVVLTTILSQSQGNFGRCVESGERVLWAQDFPTSVQLLSADSWLRNSVAFNDPQSAMAASPLDASLVGWTNVSLQVSPEKPGLLTVYQRETVAGFGWACFFLMLGLVVWRGGRNAAVAFALAAGTALATLLVAEPFVLVCRATFLAVAAGSVTLLLRTKKARVARSREDSLLIRVGGDAVVATSILILVATLLAMLAQHGLAQDPAADTGERLGRLFEVYYAVGQDGERFDNNYHVPVEFDQALKKLEFELTAAHVDWLLEACDYSATLEANADGVQLRSLQIDCEITTSSADEARISLPLREDEVQLVTATVDEDYIYRDWSQDGESLELVVKGAQRYRLRISIRPRVRRDAEQQGFDIQIPALPTSRLTVRGLNTDQVEIANRAGRLSPNASGSGFVAELGSQPRLGVAWKTDSQATESAPMINVVQHVWLRPQSGVVTLDALFTVTVVSGRLEHVSLDTDPRLQMLPLPDDLPVRQLDVRHGSQQEITLTLDRAYRSGESLTLPLSFVLPAVAGDLTLSGPLVRPRDLTPDLSYVGVSSPTGLHSELIAADSTEIEGDMFASAWAIMQTPEQALQLPGENPAWSLQLSRRKPRITTVEETQLVVGRGHASIDYWAEIEITEHPVLQFELQTPPTLKISRLQILDEDVDVVRRWFADERGVTTVFLTRPLLESARLELSGAMSLQNRLAFAGLRIDAVETAARTIRILRKPQVLLEVTSHPGFDVVETDESALQLLKSGRLVMTMQENNTKLPEPVVLLIKPNPAVFTASLATTLRPAAPGWQIEADLSLKVEAGVLDVLRWKLPRALADGVLIDPSYLSLVQDVPGQAEVLLIVRPQEPITSTAELHLRAPLVSADGGRVSAPNIEVLDAKELKRTLVLPLRSGQEEIKWDTRGLVRPVRDDQNITYAVGDRRMRATIRDERRAAGTSRVLLADTRIEWRRDGSFAGLVSFDLAPGGDSVCDLRVPPGVEIVHLQTAGLASPVEDIASLAASGGVLQVPLAVERLPQRLTILFNGQASLLAAPRHGKYLQIPWIEHWDVEKTLWTLHRVNVGDNHQPLLAHAIRPTQRMQEVRSEQITALLQIGEQASSQHRTDDFATWRSTWTQRLKQTQAGRETAEEPARRGWLGYIGSNAESTEDGKIECEFAGAAPSLTLLEPGGISTSVLKRALAAFTISCFLLLLFLARCWQPFWDFLAKWPHLTGVSCGLVWWLFLAPSVLGWVIVALSLLSAVRPVASMR